MDNKPEITKTHCDRCGNELDDDSVMSWFTQDILCKVCQRNEFKLKKDLPFDGINFKGCGYIPNVRIDVFK